MRRSQLLGVFAAALAAAATLPASAAGKPEVTVFAGASLREAFEAAAPEFTRVTGYPVRFSFGGSDTLAAQMQQGAPADVFVSANEAQMLRVADLVVAPKILVHNRLVVIAPAGDRTVAAIRDLGRAGVKVVLAASTVPVGAYARQSFVNLARNPEYGGGFAQRVAANVVSEETDVKAVVTKIVLGEGDAGVVYATDVTPVVAAKLRVLRFPPGVAPLASYPIAALKAAPNADGARRFVDFVTSPAGLAYLKARGFEE
jgi:molybdate transport system substrate-binding protein